MASKLRAKVGPQILRGLLKASELNMLVLMTAAAPSVLVWGEQILS